MTSAKSDRAYAVQKDGLWLVNSCHTGMREFNASGRMEGVPTGLYSANIADALVMEYEHEARRLAERLGAKAVSVKVQRMEGCEYVDGEKCGDGSVAHGGDDCGVDDRRNMCGAVAHLLF